MSSRPAEAGNPASWSGASSSDWFTQGNWIPSAIPDANSSVTIDLVSPNAAAVDGGAAVANDIKVGISGTGRLSITNGGSLATINAVLGVSSNSNGTITVTGAGSALNGTSLSVGASGSGTLQVLGGGAVSMGGIDVGGIAGGTGNVTVSGAASSLTIFSSSVIGRAGSGALTIANGGQVNSYGGTGVGLLGPSVGTVNVDGAGSAWMIGTIFEVGVAGQGTVIVSNGGLVSGVNSSFNTIIGLNSQGTMVVTGAGSSWVSTGHVDLGYGAGGTGILMISNGGSVTAPSLTLGTQAGSSGQLYIGSVSAAPATAPGTLNVPVVQFGAGLGAINFNHTSSNYTFAPQITGAGTVNQLSGYTELAAANSYTGSTQITGGTLAVTGSIENSSGVLVQTGGTLAGTGRVAPTIVQDGILSPGVAGTGTLTVQTSLVLQSAATYLVQINGNSSTSTSVIGTAQIDGTVSVVPIGHVGATTTYTILDASAGRSGTFASLVFNNTGLARNPRLTYTSNSVLMTLDPGLLSPTLSAGSTVNQRNVAAGIDGALSIGTVPSNGFNTLLGLTGAALDNALTQASGETATGAQQTTFDAMGQFINTMLDPFLGSRADGGRGDAAPLAYAGNGGAQPKPGRDAFASMTSKAPASEVPRWKVWAAGYGGSQVTDGSAVVGSNTASSRIAGTAVGADYLLSPNTSAGFALGGGGTSYSIANGLGGGRSDLFQAGIYARHTVGNAYAAGALAYGWQDVTTNRTVTIAGAEQLQARFNANAWSARFEGGYRFATAWMGITPYAAAQFTSLMLPGYGEQAVTGANTFALNYAGKDVTSSRSELGLRADRSFALQTAILTLRGRTAWAHDYNPDRTISATFQTLPGASFVVNGAAQAHDAALTTASAELKWLNGWALAASFEGEFSNLTRSYVGKGSVRYAW